MRKKILFMLISMNVGGTERAFLNMLHEFPEEEYEVTLLLLQKKGGLYQEIPDHVIVRVMKEFSLMGPQLSYKPKEKLKDHIFKRRYKQSFFLFALHSYMKVTKDRSVFFNKLFKEVPLLEEEFDIAVAFAGPMDFISYYIANRVKAVEKIQWIHFDVNQIGFDPRFARRMYQSFDRICVVSDTAASNLKEKIPSLGHKIVTRINTLPTSIIHQLADEEDVLSISSTIKIVTVARIAEEKGPDIAVKVLSELRQRGYDVKWHWVGDGEWKGHIKELIQELNVRESFILEGTKRNPYPYIRQSDIYVQPSRHEGYCLTLAEARTLEKPIVTTATAGGKEQITHEKTGLISGLHEQDLLQNIIKLIENLELRNELTEALQNENDSKLIPLHLNKSSGASFESNLLNDHGAIF